MNLLGSESQGTEIGLKIAEKAAPNKSLCPSLSLKTRITGWFICFCLGTLISLLSTGMLFKAAK